MRKIFVILFLMLLPCALFSQGWELLKDAHPGKNIRNNVWIWITGDIHTVDTFLYNFDLNYVERTVLKAHPKNGFLTLKEPEFSMCKNLLEIGRVRLASLPNAPFIVGIVTDNTHGVLIWWWNDNMDIPGLAAPGLKTMARSFFELKSK